MNRVESRAIEVADNEFVPVLVLQLWQFAVEIFGQCMCVLTDLQQPARGEKTIEEVESVTEGENLMGIDDLVSLIQTCSSVFYL